MLEYSAHTARGPLVQAQLRAITGRAGEQSRQACEMCGEAATECEWNESVKTLCGGCAAHIGYRARPPREGE